MLFKAYQLFFCRFTKITLNINLEIEETKIMPMAIPAAHPKVSNPLVVACEKLPSIKYNNV